MLYFFAAVLCAVSALLLLNRALSRLRWSPARTSYDYDVIIVGGSITGPVLAKALSDQGRKVLMVERTLFTKPDRIVGELLQPGGLNALKEVGMKECAETIGMPCRGYVVVDHKGNHVELPYRKGASGVSFHFGDFVQSLRSHVFHKCKANVTMIEGTVNNILTEGLSFGERAYGVEYTVAEKYEVPANPFREDPPKANRVAPTVRKVATAPLVVMCDGGMSKWKSRYQHYTPAYDYHSHFIGLVLKTVRLPKEQRGAVFLGKTGPILSYRLDDNELRLLVDYNKPILPSLEKQSEWLIQDVAPRLPENMREEFVRVSKDTKSLRSMPMARYPPAFPSIKGYVGIGDHANQRHPLTGGGMTCCFRDAIRLANSLNGIQSLRSVNQEEMAAIEDKMQAAILNYARYRYTHSCCINLLSWALYSVLSSPALRDASLDYFLCGGNCVTGPMDLLAGLDPNVGNLFFHYCCVMLHGVANVMMRTGAYSEAGKQLSNSEKLTNVASFFVDWERIKHAAYLLGKSTKIALPLAKNEFYSMWRFVDPTSPLANISKSIKTMVYTRQFNGKQRKPVGL
ncbi:squalene monooxygenase-like protein [Leishmania infantum JPCM5]|uniref:Squalene monooxygenase n=2 Tax=Leishmania infantum TaxID=5671 RepID=A0A6L0WP97_LEIIN|nr:squalene monooxygenase-like protein [Leishmania infantum JPCM5]CAC9467142.1 squalene_monooxygenase-like_protein [Leishmania infantum]CAM66558.1 squalene monooxygenase-like protein [Leishmania infantum JPCM5]SUZ40216.1 squalene_monooxygenase-like_protein [Leishmania infantum]|eukprot:XP_001464181.1 squalene monooxygenase-like protein [Leishmania infantum JPCM5]